MKPIQIICVTALSAAIAACSNTQSEKTATTTASAKAPAAAPAGKAMRAKRGMKGRHGMKRMRGHHAWFASMLLGATHQLKLTDAQKTSVQKVKQELATPDETGKKAFKDYQDALSAGVKAGKIDTAKLGPLYDEIDKAMQAKRDKEIKALNDLHAALDAPARKALVDAVRKRQSMRAERAAKRPKAAAKLKNWKATFMKNRLGRMTKELDLDADQQKKVDALLKQDQPPAPMQADKDAMKKRVDALLTAFEKDTFDAKTLDLGDLPAKKMRAHMDHRVQFLNKLLPILKPEQRAKYATAMQRRPVMRGHMGPMRGEGPRRLHMQLPFDQAPEQTPAAPGAQQQQ